MTKNWIKVFEILKKEHPKPDIELNYNNHFTLLIAILLSARATDKIVNRATTELFKKYQTPYDFVNLKEEDLHPYLKIIGLYKNKTKNILKLSQILIDQFSGEVPKDFDSLVGLPGVGRKTANVFLAEAINAPVIGVDTHVYRVSRRLGIAKSTNLKKLEYELYENIPKEMLTDVNQILVLHGRYICKARKPECAKCNIKQYCDFYKKNSK